MRRRTTSDLFPGCPSSQAACRGSREIVARSAPLPNLGRPAFLTAPEGSAALDRLGAVGALVDLGADRDPRDRSWAIVGGRFFILLTARRVDMVADYSMMISAMQGDPTMLATLDEIRPSRNQQHPTDPQRVADLVVYMETHHGWGALPPVLAVEESNDGAEILDGHHRLAAAREYGLDRVLAYIVTVADYTRVIDSVFGGYAPPRLSDLDDCIRLPDGSTYQRP